ncbi:DUF177 domain-containing protein [Robiginitalea sp. M366]|uniref:YceD family protein n=1 Tax=Robiginitalea aestuariiviva TaxID=3036903 RepID=UPI00240DCF7E|nr:DUF177 domain-containing protein [Robiginitalea aestuariiviva]MDG1571571.1 DUF177 domain-containing protein [Robiginitalea aestuariiviva]
MDRKMKIRDYDIPFSGLKLGKHQFEYQIDQTFFDAFGYEEFNGASLRADVTLEKMSTMLELEMQAAGTVNVNCDITNEPFDLPVEGGLKLVVKFGEEYNDEDDEVLVLPHGEHQLNIAQYLYEMLVLAVPSKRIHPGVADGTLKSEMLRKLEELQPKAPDNKTDKTDPRWDALRDLLTDKK